MARPSSSDSSWDRDLQIERICDQFERALQDGETICIEQLLVEVDQPCQPILLRQLLQLEIHYRREQGEKPSRAEYCGRFPAHSELVNQLFAEFDCSRDSGNDRDLLFGVLAVQLEFVNSQQLMDACDLWAAQKDKPRRQLLIEQNKLTDEQVREVDRLLALKLRNVDGDATIGLSKALDEVVEQAGEDPADGDGQPALTQLWTRGYVLRDILAQPQRRHRYTLTRLHCEGGVGRVWLARDPLLNREVALKEIRPDKHSQEETVRRFIREAQVAGQLEHPNIVPVHDLEMEDGNFFYTMRFMRGQTLRKAIRDFHAQISDEESANMGLRQLLSSFVAVCRAVDYAHSRGIVHRDIKPSNVVLGDFGEVVLLDWGLAKLVGEEDDSEELPSVCVEGLAQGEFTQDGQTVGTLGYMAPEQAKGRQRMIDQRSDIYSLGATLFEILTSKAPHRGTDSREIVEQIITGPIPRAKSVFENVAPPLDAICARAMAKKRSHRYQSAADLAQDIERWLADESVSVYDDPVSVRLARWTRRHRTWAQSIATALLLVAVVATVAAITVRFSWKAERAARMSASEARSAEEVAKQEAVRRFDESLETVDTMLTGVSDVLRYYPGAQPLRRRLLEAAAEEYERFSVEKSGDPKLAAQAGRAMRRLGEVHQLLGNRQEAVPSVEQARQIFDDLSPSETGPIDVRLESAMCAYRLGQVQRDAGKYLTAKSEFESALSSVAGEPAAAYRHMAAKTLIDLAVLHEKMGQLDLAIENVEKAKISLSALGSPDRRVMSQYRSRQALAQSVSSHLRTLAGQNEEAHDDLRAAIETYGELCELDPDEPQYREGLAFSRIHLAQTLGTLGLIQQRQATLGAAAGDLELLLEAMPGVPGYHEQLAVTRANLGDLLHDLGHNHEARDQLDTALAEFERLVSTRDPLPRYVEQLAIACIFQGRVLHDLGGTRARDNVDTAIRLFKMLVENDDITADYHRGLAFSQMTSARLALGDQQYEDAVSRLRQSQESFTRAIQLDSSDIYSIDGQATCWEYLGDVYHAMGEHVQAGESYDQAISVRDSLPNYAEFDYKRASLLFKIDTDAAINTALILAEQLCNSAPENPRFVTLLGALQCRHGDLDLSVDTLSEVDRSFETGDPTHLFWLAKAFWLRNQDNDRRQAVSLFQQAVERMDQLAPRRIGLLRLKQELAETLELPPHP